LSLQIAGAGASSMLRANSVTLGQNVTLSLEMLGGYFAGGDGSLYFVADVLGSGTFGGRFANATAPASFGEAYDGETLEVLMEVYGPQGQQFAISYDGDATNGTFHGGNDAVLMAIPEPTGAGMLVAGGAMLIGLQRMRRRGRSV
jgi:hypothetical protein